METEPRRVRLGEPFHADKGEEVEVLVDPDGARLWRITVEEAGVWQIGGSVRMASGVREWRPRGLP